MTHADKPLTSRSSSTSRARRADVQALLETLTALGHGEAVEGAFVT